MVLGLSVVVVSLLGFIAAAAPGVATSLGSRADSLIPHRVSPDHDAKFAFAVLDQDRLWAGDRVTRVFLAGKPERVPGLDRAPGPGEVFVSPRLRDRIESRPVAGALVRGYRVVGVIGSEGLTGPDESRAVFGLSPATFPQLTPGDGFGASVAAAPGEGRVLFVTGVILGLLVIAPAIALVFITARLAETERGRRAAILRMLGASRRQAFAVGVVEASLVSVPAVCLALMMFLGLGRTDIRVPVVGVSVFAGTVRLPWWTLAAICVGVVVAYAFVYARAALLEAPSVYPLLQTHPPRPWAARSFFVGVFLLCAITVVGVLPPSIAGVAFFLGAGSVALSMAAAVPALLSLGARAAASRARTGGTLCGLRVLAENALPSTRLAAVAGLAVITLGTAVPFLAILRGGSEADLATYSREHPRTVLSVFGSGPGTRSVSSEQALLLQRARTVQGREVTVLVADCADLRTLLAREVPGCEGSGTWLSDASELAPADEQVVTRRDGRSATIRSTDAAARIPDLPAELVGSYLMAPQFSKALRTTADGYVMSVPTRTVNEVSARITSAAPWAVVRTADFEFSDPDQQQYPGTRSAVVLGGLSTVALLTLIVMSASFGEVVALRHRTGLLDVLGASRADFLRFHFLCTGLPTLVAGCLATVVALLVGLALGRLDERAAVSPLVYAAMILGALGGATVSSLVSLPLARSGRPDRASAAS